MYESEDESNYDNEDSYSDIVYEPEELSTSRFCIALCDLYNDKIHGTTNIQGHYLVNCRYKMLHMDWITETTEFINNEYKLLHSYHHDLFPNYRNIVLQENYIKPEIIECIDKEGICIAIIKTFWIKIVQRTWKNIFKRRKEAFKYRQTLSSINYYNLTGKWPANCYAYGGLRGMLINVSF